LEVDNILFIKNTYKIYNIEKYKEEIETRKDIGEKYLCY